MTLKWTIVNGAWAQVWVVATKVGNGWIEAAVEAAVVPTAADRRAA